MGEGRADNPKAVGPGEWRRCEGVTDVVDEHVLRSDRRADILPRAVYVQKHMDEEKLLTRKYTGYQNCYVLAVFTAAGIYGN